MKTWVKVIAILLTVTLLGVALSCTPKAATSTAATGPLQQLEKRVDDLEKAYVNLTTAQSGVTKAQIDSINAQIASINATVQSLQTQVTAPNIRLTQIEADIVALQKLIADMTALNAKITALEAKVNAIAPVDISGLQSAITALQAKNAAQDAEIAALKARLTALETPPTTTAPPTTTPALSAKDAVEIQVVWLGSMAATQDVTTTEKTYYIALNYKNTANQQFTGVKYQFALLLSGITFDAAAPTTNEMKIYTVPVTPLSQWTRASVAANVWTFTNFTAFTVGAQAEGSLLLEVTIDSNTAGSVSLALAQVL